MLARIMIRLLFLLAITATVSAQDTPAAKLTQYQDAQNVKVSYDAHAVLSKSILNQIVNSPAVKEQAARDINGKALAERLQDEDYLVLDGEKLYAGIQFTPDQEQQIVMTGGTAFGTLHAFLNASKEKRIADAEYRGLVAQYLQAACKRLEESLDTVARREFDKHLRREAQSVAQERELADAAQHRVRQKREQLQKVAASVPQRVLEESVSNLQKQQQALELDVAGLKARAEAIQEQIKRASEDLKKAAPDEAVLKHLERVLQVRADQLSRLREIHRQGAVSATEIAKAEEEVALAQVNRAQAMREAGKSISDRIEKLNAELAQIAVARAEFQAKAEYVEKHLAEALTSLQNEIQSAQPLRDEISAESAAAQAMAIEARKREAELRRLEGSYSPASVEVFDLTATEDKPAAGKAEKGR